MPDQNSKPNSARLKWLRVLVSFLAGAVIFATIVAVLWLASFYSRLFLPFDTIFQSPAILSIPAFLIPPLFYIVLALPPVLVLAVLISWAFARNLRRSRKLHLALSILIGVVSVPLSFLLVSIVGMVMSGSASDAAAFAFLAPFPPSFVLGFLPAWKLGRLLYNKWTARLVVA